MTESNRSTVPFQLAAGLLSLRASNYWWGLPTVPVGPSIITRWGFKRFIDAGAPDILQPDIYWCGGLSETLKIAAYATVHDLITIPHGHSTPAGIHVSVTQPPIHTPYQEYLVKWNDIHQHFLAHPVRPQRGEIHLPPAPGLGMDLDPAEIEHEEEAFAP
jgi:L-rhamnonate dehydratase